MSPRKRPFPKPGEKWGPKKHANRRISHPPFIGKFMDTGERLAAIGPFDSGKTSQVARQKYFRDGPPIGEVFTLRPDNRKKEYRYRKPKK